MPATAEAELHRFPQFTMTMSVDGHEDLELHIIHQES